MPTETTSVVSQIGGSKSSLKSPELKSIDQLTQQANRIGGTDTTTLFDTTLTGFKNFRSGLESVYGSNYYQCFLDRLRVSIRIEKHSLSFAGKTASTIDDAIEIANGIHSNGQLLNRLSKLNIALENGWLDRATYRMETLGLSDPSLGSPKKAKASLRHFLNNSLGEHTPKSIKQDLINHIVNDRLEHILMSFPQNKISLNDIVDGPLNKLSTLLNGFFEAPCEHATVDLKIILAQADIYLANILFPGYKTEIRVGFGGSEDPVNARTCTYIIPALEEMKRHTAVGIKPPSLVIVFGANAAISLNGMNPELVHKNMQDTIELCRAFISSFYPELSTHIDFVSMSQETLEGDDINDFKEILRNVPIRYKQVSDQIISEFNKHTSIISQETQATLEDINHSIVELTSTSDVGRLTKRHQQLLGILNDKKNSSELIQQKATKVLDGMQLGINFNATTSEEYVVILTKVLQKLNEYRQNQILLDTISYFKNLEDLPASLCKITQSSKEKQLLNNLLVAIPQLAHSVNTLATLFRVQKALEVLTQRGEKRGSQDSETVLHYVAMHVHEQLFAEIVRVDAPSKPHAIIKMGGQGESWFNIVQDWLAETVFESGDRQFYRPNAAFDQVGNQLARKLKIGGDPPPYYQVAGEVSLADFSKLANWTELEQHYVNLAKKHTNIASGLQPKFDKDLSSVPPQVRSNYVEFLIEFHASNNRA